MAGEERKSEGTGFTVQDRRRFSPETGEAREDVADTASELNQSSQPVEEPKSATGTPQHEPLPAINFSTFVISLSTQALMHLGEIPDPITNQITADVEVAKQMIDIIAMLKDKTRGNLGASEDRLMDDILFDLRMKYVEAVKKR
jgi:uncharacterized protein DUF1844